MESDHTPILLDLCFCGNCSEQFNWKLDSTLLADDSFSRSISAPIESFLQINQSDSVTPSLLWETLEVAIRDEIISYTATCNKIRKLKQEQLIQSIFALDQDTLHHLPLNYIRTGATITIQLIINRKN